MSELISYNLGAPIAICEHELKTLVPVSWSTGEGWVVALKEIRPTGIVLPLELTAPPLHRQSLWGMELLKWLRWSGDKSVRYLPVLAVAWQSAADILRRTPDLLLVGRGTRFARLPAPEVLQDFIRRVRDGTAEQADASALESASLGALDSAMEVTHHDLANDNYAAYRLWVGYLAALDTVTTPTARLKTERELAAQQNRDRALGCLRVVEPRRQQPWFKQLQTSLVRGQPPDYPEVTAGDIALRRHVEKGLPDRIRILFVDDEFQKGMAEVLLRILFGQGKFTLQRKTEWVYSEQADTGVTKARFVCVADVKAAQNWLRYWGDLPPARPGSSEFKEYLDWVFSWAGALGWKSFPPADAQLNPKTLAGLAFAPTDPAGRKLNEVGAPAKMKTILLLDLRLEKLPPGKQYKTEDLSSVKLRAQIKEHKPKLPVIVFTASRQALNYAEVMRDAGPIDGWLCKEAPDVLENSENSKNAVLYLLARLHLKASLGMWYREEMDWKEVVLEYQEMLESGARDECLQLVAKSADEFYKQVIEEEFVDEKSPEYGFRGFIRSRLTCHTYEGVVHLLVARRVAIATLLHTARWEGRNLKWSVPEFAKLLPVSKSLKSGATRLDNVINFRRDLQLASHSTGLLDLLLPEEYEWLLSEGKPGAEREDVKQELLRRLPSGNTPSQTLGSAKPRGKRGRSKA